jgi:ATP-dependent Lon protease
MKTAIEFLEEFFNNDEQKSDGVISLAFAKAKEMEKQQMEDMFETGHICGVDDCHKMNKGEIFTSVTFEQYYNETFKKDGI